VAKDEKTEGLGLKDQVRGAVLWRSGSQLAAQVVTWASTFLVIRLLNPGDYGLYAMAQAMLTLLNLFNGWGFANALIRGESVTRQQIAQAFGMLILLNGGLALAQILLAPLAAVYFHQPQVADLLRVQALIYLATPFIAVPSALLSRQLDFRRQAKVHMTAALAGAGTALTCALSGFGVWTLVAAPMALFWTQAIGMTLMARQFVWPSFRFKGSDAMVRYGGAMVIAQFCWFVQSQSDVFIAGRLVGPHELGLYTTALFLTQILSSKFIPPLNDVAFAAYSRIGTQREAVAQAFLKSARLIMLVALPFYFGLAATSEPLVLTVLGPKWAETVPMVRLLALAMPLMALQILFGPANNALGHTAVTVRNAAIGALLMPVAFAIGVQHGTIGLAWAWLIAMPLFAAVTVFGSMRVIGFALADLGRAIAPGLLASAAMASGVLLIDRLLPGIAPHPRLALLVTSGAAIYAGLLILFARPLVLEAIGLVRGRPAAMPA
jgi:O-antigen/teichoic acid export membrane protein